MIRRPPWWRLAGTCGVQHGCVPSTARACHNLNHMHELAIVESMHMHTHTGAIIVHGRFFFPFFLFLFFLFYLYYYCLFFGCRRHVMTTCHVDCRCNVDREAI